MWILHVQAHPNHGPGNLVLTIFCLMETLLGIRKKQLFLASYMTPCLILTIHFQCSVWTLWQTRRRFMALFGPPFPLFQLGFAAYSGCVQNVNGQWKDWKGPERAENIIICFCLNFHNLKEEKVNNSNRKVVGKNHYVHYKKT